MARTGAHFGSALALLDHNGDGRLDLTVGSSGVEVGAGQSTSKGSLVTMLGRRRGLAATSAFGVDWTILGATARTPLGLGTVIGS